MKNISIFLLFITVLIFIGPVHAQDSSAIQIRDGVFIHLSHGVDSPHRLLMALKMAVTMAEGQKDVFVYCDIEAVKVLSLTAKNVSMKGFPTLHELLTRLAELKVPIVACPTCMRIAGIAEQDLRTGVKVAQRDLFFSFTKGRILSLDY